MKTTSKILCSCKMYVYIIRQDRFTSIDDIEEVIFKESYLYHSNLDDISHHIYHYLVKKYQV